VKKTGVCEGCKAFTRPDATGKMCISDKCKADKNEKITMNGKCEACKADEKLS